MLNKPIQTVVFVLALIWTSVPSFAGPYDPVIRVNDQVITEFELEQRQLFQAFLGATGNLRQIAEDQLIEDRLKMSAAKSLDITISPDQVLAGLEQFAARGELSAAELISILETQGVYRETFEDFVEAGIAWNQVISARFGFRGFLSEQEIDAELAVGTSNRDAIELLLSEIVIPFQARGEEGSKELAENIRREILRGEATFAVSAAQYSETPTASNGGVRDWVALNSLSENIVGPLIGGGVGTLSEPIELGNAVGLFQLRGIRTNNSSVTATTVEFMTLALPVLETGGVTQSTSKALENVDTCNDLRSVSNSIQPNSYMLNNVLEGSVGAQYAASLSDLDVNEYKTVSRQNAQEVIMVCSRQRDLQEDARSRLRNLLGNRRVESFGEAYLQELTGNAFITRF